MISLGVGSVIGGPLNGYLLDTLGYKRALLFNLAEVCAAFSVILAFVYYNKFDLIFASAFNFLWGIQDSGANNFINCVMGFQFISKTIPFSIFYFVQSFACFTFIYL